MIKIITDQSALRQISKLVDEVHEETINFLIENTINDESAAGLSAPQIGVFERIFIAKLSMGTFIFVNPEITKASKDKVPSVEGCLSVPDTTWCIARHKQITINAEYIYLLHGSFFGKPSSDFPNGIRVRDFDAFLIQHEYDHLEGVLMIDHPQTLDREELITEKQSKRAKRLETRKAVKRSKKEKQKKIQKISAKRASALKKSYKSAMKRMKKRIEVQEHIRAEKENLFAD